MTLDRRKRILLKAIRAGILLIVDAIEAYLGITPRTAALRWRVRRRPSGGKGNRPAKPTKEELDNGGEK